MLGSGEIVVMDLPEWLPAGWTDEFKVLRSGRKVNMYTNMQNGKRLFSKDDVLHHITMEQANYENPPSTDKSFERQSEINSSQLLNENEHPEWLPKDWKVVVKTRYGGATIGRKYKIFIDPHGYRFFSKPQVIRYLTTGEQKSCKPRYVQKVKHRKSHILKKKNTGTNKQSVMNELEDLPPGWKKWYKIRSANPSKKDPFYTDPVSGYVFRSKKDVMRYLETGDINQCACRPKTLCSNDQDLTSGEKVTLSFTAKKQKLNPPASRRQLFADEMNSETSILALSSTEGNFGFSDPYAARTDIIQQKLLLENSVHRCAETEQNCASDSSPLSEAEISKVTPDTGNVAETRHDSTPAPVILQEEYSLVYKTPIKSSKYNGKKMQSLSRRCSKRLAGLEPYDVVKSFPAEQAPQVIIKKSGIVEAIHDEGLMTNNLVNVAPQQPESGQETELPHSASIDVNALLCLCPSNKSMMPLQMVEADKTDAEEPDQKLSFLFDSDPCLEFAFKTLTGELPVTDTADKGPNCYPAAGILESKLDSEMKNCHNAKVQGTSSKSRKCKEHNLPKRSSKRSSKRLAGLESELEIHCGGSKPVIQDATRAPLYEIEAAGAADSVDETGQLKTGLANHAYINLNTLAVPWNKTNKSLEDHPGQPREQQQMLGTQSADLEKLKPRLSFSLGNCWCDPSHDLSFKNLKGAMPMEDSLLKSRVEEQHNSFQKQEDNCFVLPDFRSFSFFGTEMSSHYDTSEGYVSGQENSMNSSFLAAENSSLPSCSNPQQQCLEGKKDFPGRLKS